MESHSDLTEVGGLQKGQVCLIVDNLSECSESTLTQVLIDAYNSGTKGKGVI